MLIYIIRRVLAAIPVMFGVVTITFLLMHLSPGDPALNYLGIKATPASLSALRHEWGLDLPLWRQYLDYLWGILRGDLGSSIFFHTPNTILIAGRFPATLMLMVVATVFSVVISLVLGTWVAFKENTIVDEAVRLFNALVQGMPTFLLGTVLLIIFALSFRMFPVGGFGRTFPDQLHSIVLPALTVALGVVPVLVRSLRSSMIDSLGSEFVAFGRAKGLRNSSVLLSYALRNGSISGVSILGIYVGSLAGGALVIENVFAIPGLGSLLMTAILNRDFATVQATTLVFALIVVVVYLLTDLAYALLDPRVRPS